VVYYDLVILERRHGGPIDASKREGSELLTRWRAVARVGVLARALRGTRFWPACHEQATWPTAQGHYNVPRLPTTMGVSSSSSSSSSSASASAPSSALHFPQSFPASPAARLF
jgi:hypothetical protein